MFQPVSLYIGLRYSRATKGNGFVSFISFFSIAGIALGLMALITVSSVMNGFEQSLKNAMLDLIPHVQLHKSSDEQSHDAGALLIKLSALPGVKRVTPYVTSDVILQTNKDLVGVRLQGAFSGYPSALEPHIEAGSLAQFREQKYQLALSRYLANQLDVRLGQKVRVIMPDISSYTPMGRVPKQRLFTVALIYNTHSEADVNLAFADGKSLQRLLQRKPTDFDVSITLKDAFAVNEFKTVHAPLLSGLEYSDWHVQQGALFAAVAMEKRIMSLLLGLIVIVAVFNIVSALSMMVSEKQGEVAILQTLGLAPDAIARVFMVQGLYNGVVGTLIGIVFGYLLASHINEVLAVSGLSLLGGAELPVRFDWLSLSLIVATSLVLSFLATLYPAFKAAKVLPAEVLRYE